MFAFVVCIRCGVGCCAFETTALSLSVNFISNIIDTDTQQHLRPWRTLVYIHSTPQTSLIIRRKHHDEHEGTVLEVGDQVTLDTLLVLVLEVDLLGEVEVVDHVRESTDAPIAIVLASGSTTHQLHRHRKRILHITR